MEKKCNPMNLEMATNAATELNNLLRISYVYFSEYPQSYEKRLEIMIYAEYFLLIEVHDQMPDYYKLFSASTHEFMKEWAEKFNLIDKLPCDFFAFVNGRYKTYHKELEEASKANKPPYNILRNLFEEPLLKDIERGEYDFLGAMSKFIELPPHQKFLMSGIKSKLTKVRQILFNQ